FTVKNRRRGRNRRQFQFFLGFEVRIEAALAHPDFGGQVADRQAIQSMRRGEFGCGEQNGGATGLALRGVGPAAYPTTLTKRCAHTLKIARTVVIIKGMHEERPIVLFCEPIPFCRPAEGIEYSVRAQGCGACCVTRATRTTKFGATMSGSRIMRFRNVLILIA